MIPTPPDESDHMHPSFNPKVPGSRPGRLTGSSMNIALRGTNVEFVVTKNGDHEVVDRAIK
jgi:hypothetical protein